MTRVIVVCEGQTEESFVQHILGPYFAVQGIYLFLMLIGKAGHKGGNFKIERLLRDLKAILLGDRRAYCTTFFDFYGLPAGFPGKEEALSHATAVSKSQRLLEVLVDFLIQELARP